MKLQALILAAIIGLVSYVFALSINADEMPAGPHLSTMGTASMDVTPDMATISIEVSFSAKDAIMAKKQVDTRVTQYIYFLRKKGIEKKDINAANLTTQPEYDYQKTGKAVLKAYRAVRQVQVTVLQLDKLNGLLDGALKLGLNEIRTIKLGVANPNSYREQVRKKAIENAILRATSLAEGFKVKLGPVYSIHYQGDNDQTMPLPIMFMRAENVPPNNPDKTYQQETILFKDQVDAVFELQNGLSTAR
ncbi:MAG: oxidative stress defense protein [Candidatus Aquirickettsiella sp.]